MIRDDIQGINRCPSDIADYLTTIGGQTPFGEPIWRLVVADSVIWKVAGGKVWDENLSIADRGGILHPAVQDSACAGAPDTRAVFARAGVVCQPLANAKRARAFRQG